MLASIPIYLQRNAYLLLRKKKRSIYKLIRFSMAFLFTGPNGSYPVFLCRSRCSSPTSSLSLSFSFFLTLLLHLVSLCTAPRIIISSSTITADTLNCGMAPRSIPTNQKKKTAATAAQSDVRAELHLEKLLANCTNLRQVVRCGDLILKVNFFPKQSGGSGPLFSFLKILSI